MVSMSKSYAWLDGKIIDSEKAKVHLLTHSMQYGSGIFEGIRAYSTPKGPAIFRLREHMARFLRTSKIFGMELALDEKGLEKAAVAVVSKNRFSSCYIRPFAFYNDTRLGLGVEGKKTSVSVMAVPMGSYFGNKEKGIKCKISSWHRINSLILPPNAKLSGNYANSILASIEAKKTGADEAIMLSTDGWVSEGPGENLFMVEENKLITPSKSADILLGITRDSIIKIAENTGIEVEEREVHREELFTADELFFSGTAAEITPITAVDSKRIGTGRPGPITKLLNEKYVGIVSGKEPEFAHWLTYVR